MNSRELGKFLCLILRHQPEVIGLNLDSKGRAQVSELIAKVNAQSRFALNRELLEEILRTDNKQRYSLSEDHSLIWANQGHSLSVSVDLMKIEPPDVLYHGSATRFVSSIKEQGLLPMSRLYVHLSGDKATAYKVGARHGKVVVYEIAAARMSAQGFQFYRSANGVYLVKSVPVEFLTLLED